MPRSHTASLLHHLGSEPDLHRKVTAAVRVGGRRWNAVQLAGGIDVQLPESGAGPGLGAVWPTSSASTACCSAMSLAIDLRLPDRLVIRTDPAVTIEPPREGRWRGHMRMRSRTQQKDDTANRPWLRVAAQFGTA